MNVDDLEGPLDTIVLCYTYIFPDHEPVCIEPEDRFVILVSGFVGKSPIAVAAMDQRSSLVIGFFPEPADSTDRLVPGPARGIEMPLGVQGSRELVAMARATVWKLRRPGQFKSNTLKGHVALPSVTIILNGVLSISLDADQSLLRWERLRC